MPEPIFDAPIPGSSLTKEVGASPVKNPPQYTTVDEAIEFYVKQMSTEQFSNQVADVLEMGVPITSLVNIIQMHSVMEGRHTLDVSVMLMPILMEMIALVGDMHGVEYDMGIDDEDDPERASDALVEVATQKLKQQQYKNRNGGVAEEPIVDEMPEDVSAVNEMSSGLMSRGL